MNQGVVSVGATEIALRCYLLPVLKEYHRRYPGVRIKILNVSTPQALKMVESNLVDLAFVTTPVDSGPKIRTTALTSLREVPVCAKTFPIGERATLEEIGAHPIISLGAGTSTFDYYAGEFAKRNCRFSAEIEAATADQILPLVQYGLGIGFVPEPFLEKEEGVRPIACTNACFTREIVLVQKKGETPPLPARELLALSGCEAGARIGKKK